MIRPRMIRILYGREVQRLKKNPSALMLIGLLAAIALMAATSGPKEGDAAAQEEVKAMPVVVIYDRKTQLVKELWQSRPEDQTVRFALRQKVSDRSGRLMVPEGWSIVEMQNTGKDAEKFSVIARHAGKSPNSLEPFWQWFSPIVAKSHGIKFWLDQKITPRAATGLAKIQDSSISDLVKTEVIGTTLLLMVQFFSCCHLLVSFTAQDRERKTLTALALSPARLSEIMSAKALFHLSLSAIGCGLIVGIVSPASLLRPMLWVTILLTSVAMMSVGTCIATLAKNQAAAGMLALCYMMAGAILFFLSTRLQAFAILKGFSFESYSFPLLYFIFKFPNHTVIPLALVPLFVLTLGWVFAARQCFYKFGWRT